MKCKSNLLFKSTVKLLNEFNDEVQMPKAHQLNEATLEEFLKNKKGVLEKKFELARRVTIDLQELDKKEDVCQF